MRMEVREQSKIVELWLTKEEKNDPVLRESLKPIYQQYKDQKYLVAVFSPARAISTCRPGIFCYTTGRDRRNRKCRQRRRCRRRSGPG